MTAPSFFQMYSPVVTPRSIPAGSVSPYQPLSAAPAARGKRTTKVKRAATASIDVRTAGLRISALLIGSKGKSLRRARARRRQGRDSGRQALTAAAAAPPPPSLPAPGTHAGAAASDP